MVWSHDRTSTGTTLVLIFENFCGESPVRSCDTPEHRKRFVNIRDSCFIKNSIE